MNSQGKYSDVSVDEIDLDKNNPRIRRVLEIYEEEPTPEQINLALGAGSEDENDSSSGTTFEKLRQSILTCGRIIFPIVVNRRSDGSMVCVEGNTRLALYKAFRDQHVEGDWEKIPSIVHDNLADGQVDAVRLQAHLVGPRPWDPYSKAKYLNELRNEKHLPFSAVVDYCGGNRADVEESIAAFNEMEQYYRPALKDEGDFDPTRFSGFVELQRGNVKNTLIREGYSITDFSKWIIDGKLFPLNTIRSLARILKNPEALRIFLKDGAQKAKLVLEKPDLGKSLNEATLSQLCRTVSEKVLSLPYSEMQRLKADPSGDSRQAVIEASEVLADFVRDLGRSE